MQVFSQRIFFQQSLFVSLFVLPLVLFAADSGHEPLAISDSLSFEEIFASALQHTPEFLETSVRVEQAEGFNATGKSWIAGRPSLQLNYYDDQPFDNLGQTEMEYGVQLPLWRPGQRSDTRALGDSYGSQVDTWKQALAWMVTGRVRQSLGGIAGAVLGLELQAQAVEDASKLRDATQLLFDAGEVSRLELMQAETLLVEKQADMLQAEAALLDSEITYAMLTGLEARPSKTYTEILTTEEEINDSHPQLQYLKSVVNLAGANIQQSENSARGNPTLMIGSRRERADRFNDTLSSIAIQLSIPFGGGSFVSSQTSSARRAKVDAEVDYQNAYLKLNQALHEVEHDLFILGQEEPLRQQQMDLSRQRYAMSLTAFEVGETTLAQVIIAQQQAQESESNVRMLQLERQQLITEFNQLIGVMP